MFFLAFVSAWAGSTFAVVLWAALGVLFSKRSLFHSAALIVVALLFGTTTIMWYIGGCWLIQLLLGVFVVKKMHLIGKCK